MKFRTDRSIRTYTYDCSNLKCHGVSFCNGNNKYLLNLFERIRTRLALVSKVCIDHLVRYCTDRYYLPDRSADLSTRNQIGIYERSSAESVSQDSNKRDGTDLGESPTVVSICTRGAENVTLAKRSNARSIIGKDLGEFFQNTSPLVMKINPSSASSRETTIKRVEKRSRLFSGENNPRFFTPMSKSTNRRKTSATRPLRAHEHGS